MAHGRSWGSTGVGRLLLEFVDGALVNAAALVKKMARRGRLAGVDMTNHNDRNVALLLRSATAQVHRGRLEGRRTSPAWMREHARDGGRGRRARGCGATKDRHDGSRQNQAHRLRRTLPAVRHLPSLRVQYRCYLQHYHTPTRAPCPCSNLSPCRTAGSPRNPLLQGPRPHAAHTRNTTAKKNKHMQGRWLIRASKTAAVGAVYLTDAGHVSARHVEPQRECSHEVDNLATSWPLKRIKTAQAKTGIWL